MRHETTEGGGPTFGRAEAASDGVHGRARSTRGGMAAARGILARAAAFLLAWALAPLGSALPPGAALPLAGALASPAAAQTPADLEPYILLRTGLRLEPVESPREDGFEIYDLRLGARGRIGLLFDYMVIGSWESEERRFELLDARLSVPIVPEAVVSIGQFKAPFGSEFLLPLADISFVDRSEASLALVPGRQVGAQLGGALLEERLTYGAGLFNGNERELRNDDGRFLYAARAQYNTIGPIAFYRDLVVEVGANVAFSRDAAAPLGPGLQAPGVPPGVDFDAFEGERLLWGVDGRMSWRAITLSAEYLRGEFEPEAAPGQTLVAEGGYLQGGYALMGGLLEALARWDAFHPPATETRRDFLLLGVNVYPGFYTRLGLQYAISLRSGQPPGERIAGGQFALLVQIDF